jgi:hypothetical protein
LASASFRKNMQHMTDKNHSVFGLMPLNIQ